MEKSDPATKITMAASGLEYARQKAISTGLRAFTAVAIGLFRKTSQDAVLDIPSREPGRTIKTHVYDSNADSRQPRPVLLNFHGSAFVLPLHGTDDAYCQYVASKTDHVVLDVPYRLAPEYPFPAAVEDVEDALNYVLAHPETYDVSSIAVSGFSAGGTLALVLASGSGGKVSKGIVKKCAVLYPVVDLAQDPAEKIQPEVGGTPIGPWFLRFFHSIYAPGPTEVREDPRVSPFFAKPEDFCDEVLIITCGFDVLAPRAELLVEKLKSMAGKKAIRIRLDTVNHAWDKNPEKEVEGPAKVEQAYGAVVDMLKS